MTKAEKTLCDCLSCVLLGTPKRPDIEDFDTLMGAARHHAVTAMLVDLPKECLERMERYTRLQLIAESVALESKAQAMNKTIASAASMLAEKGIRYFLLKGQNCAVRYPHPERRQIGDIDLYIEPQRFDEAAEMFRSLGFNDTESTMLHLSMSDGKDTELELHHDLQRLQWPLHDKALRRMCNEASHDEKIELAGTAVRVLPQELDITVLCVHTMSHLYCAGLGLRHVCDYMMRTKWALDRGLDVPRMEKMLKEVGAYRVYRVLNHICNTYLHASLPLPMDKRNGERVLRWMLRSGNFSHGLDLGTGAMRFLRYYSQFLWHCIAFFPVSPLESLSWPVMKLKRAIKNEAHRKTDGQ